MEKLEIKKSIERTRAFIIFAMILLIVSTPTIVLGLSQQNKIYIGLLFILSTVLVLYKRVQRLSYKLTLLTK